MAILKIEQRVNLKFLVKLKKSLTKNFKLLTEVYKKVIVSHIRVFEWHKRFNEGWEEVDDDEHPGRPNTLKTNENIEKVNEIVRNDQRLGIKVIVRIINNNNNNNRMGTSRSNSISKILY